MAGSMALEARGGSALEAGYRARWPEVVARYLASLPAGSTREAYARDLLGPRSRDLLDALDRERGVAPRPRRERTGDALDLSLTGWAEAHGLDPLDLDRATADLWRDALATAYAPATVARRLASAAGVYGYAVEEGYLSGSPVARLRRPRVPAESPREGVTREEAAALLGAAEARPRDALLLGLLALLGLRASEVGRLTLADLATDRGHLCLTVSGKGGRRDRLPLPPYLADALSRLLAERGEGDGPLLLAEWGGRLDRHGVTRAVARLARAAGIRRRVCPHDLRHGFVTAALAAGVPLHAVQDAARHADPATTRRYDRARYALDGHAAYGVARYLLGAA